MTVPVRGPARERWARPAFASFGGFLVALSLPPWGFWPLAFVGVAVYEVAVRTEASRGRRAWCGLGLGLPWMFMGMGWMWFLTVPGYLIVGVLFAGLHALAAAIAPSGRWEVIGRPAAHTLVEAVRLTVPFGGVPLATLGISQAGGPLLGVARVGGVIALTWVVLQLGVVLGGMVASAVTHERDGIVRARWFGDTLGSVALVAVALVVASATVAPSGHDLDEEPLTIAAVQGGGEQGTTALDVPASLVFRRHLEATAAIEPEPGLDLVVWPENGIDVNREAFEDSEAEAAITEQASRLGVPFAVGVTIDSEYSEEPTEGGFVNAQVIVTPEGDVIDGYEKVRIVPFGEYVPFRGVLEALGAPLEQIASDAVRGPDGPAVIELDDGTRLGVMISWEVFFGDRGRAAADSDLLLNPTNGASYTGTILQTQQIASSRLRATETGRWLVQVSPTGFSAFVSPDADVFDRTSTSERAVIVRDVPRRGGTTWYAAMGDWPWRIAVAVVLGASWLLGPLADRRRQSAGSNQRSSTSST
jgi:apolipoprotein N-acyltransferase